MALFFVIDIIIIDIIEYQFLIRCRSHFSTSLLVKYILHEAHFLQKVAAQFLLRNINYHRKIDVHHHRKIIIFIIYKFLYITKLSKMAIKID